MANATKPGASKVGALKERLTELEQENDELRRALYPFEPLRELDRLADKLAVLQILAQNLLQNVGEVTAHLAEIRVEIERAEADR